MGMSVFNCVSRRRNSISKFLSLAMENLKILIYLKFIFKCLQLLLKLKGIGSTGDSISAVLSVYFMQASFKL